MFRASNSPIFRSIRLCVRACGMMYPGCCRLVAWKRRNSVPPLPGYRPTPSCVHHTTSCNTQCNAPDDGRVRRPKRVELIGIINKLLLLHLVDVYTIYIKDARSNKYQIHMHIKFWYAQLVSWKLHMHIVIDLTVPSKWVSCVNHIVLCSVKWMCLLLSVPLDLQF